MDAVYDSENAIDKRQLKALAERSDAKGLVHLAGHLAAIALSSVLLWLAHGSLWLLPAMALQGILLAFLFAPLHETIHGTAFKSRALNRWVAFLFGALLFLPSRYFRAFHFAHHRHTQDPERDPELQRPKPETIGAYLLFLSGIGYWRDAAGVFRRLAFGRGDFPFLAERERPAAAREARLLLGLYGAVAALSLWAGNVAALVYWLIPLALGQPALRLFLLPEHVGCPLVPDMLKNTRTTLTNGLVRQLGWNMSYHVEHHAYPAVPFHALPAAHALIRPRIAVLGRGYFAVHRDLARDLLARRRPYSSST